MCVLGRFFFVCFFCFGGSGFIRKYGQSVLGGKKCWKDPSLRMGGLIREAATKKPGGSRCAESFSGSKVGFRSSY